jgi:hypothetical protein
VTRDKRGHRHKVLDAKFHSVPSEVDRSEPQLQGYKFEALLRSQRRRECRKQESQFEMTHDSAPIVSVNWVSLILGMDISVSFEKASAVLTWS